MIDILLDNLYWTELDSIITRQIGNDLIFFRPVKWKQNRLLLDFRHFKRLFKKERSNSYFNEEKDALSLASNHKKFWSAKRLTHYWQKNLHLIKEGFISDIEDEISLRWPQTDVYNSETVWKEFTDYLKKEKNIQNIFILWKEGSHLGEAYQNGTLIEFAKKVQGKKK